MLTLVESISLAGNRAQQNDDAHGAFGACAWVIDGATDLHTPSLTGAASDAAWIAHVANARLYGEIAPTNEEEMRALVRRAPIARWSPTGRRTIGNCRWHRCC